MLTSSFAFGEPLRLTVSTVFPRYRATWVEGNTRIAGRVSYPQSLPFGACQHLQRVRSFTLGVAFTALPKIGIHGRLPPSVASLLSCYWRSNRLLVFAPAKIGLNAQRSKREAVRYRGLGDGATPPNFDRPPWGGLCLRDANTLAYRPKYLLLVNRSRLPPSKKLWAERPQFFDNHCCSKYISQKTKTNA